MKQRVMHCSYKRCVESADKYARIRICVIAKAERRDGNKYERGRCGYLGRFCLFYDE